MKQQRVATTQQMLKEGPLLDGQGNLIEAGYAFQLIKQYQRNQIKAHSWRIKQWDYYYVGDHQYGVALTIADLSYSGLVSVSVIDFKNKRADTKTKMSWFSFGSYHLPNSSQIGDIRREGKGFTIQFTHCGKGKRQLVCRMDDLRVGQHFSCDIHLEQSSPHSMVIATPFNQKHHFYYNQKINLLKGGGQFIFGNIHHNWKQNAYGVLDWGRGVWTYSNTWYWSSINGQYEGHLWGFNLGYGFGDSSKGTENMMFFDQQVYKLGDIVFEIKVNENGEEEYLKNWNITNKDGLVWIEFQPIVDRYANINIMIVKSVQHQVFGVFSGRVKIDDKVFRFQGLSGFAEKVINRW